MPEVKELKKRKLKPPVGGYRRGRYEAIIRFVPAFFAIKVN